VAALELLRKLRGVSQRDRLLLGEAGLWLAIASIVVATMPFRFIANIASLGVNREFGDRAGESSRIGWAVRTCANRFPWRTQCFQQSLAVHWMLRRRGISCVLYYGARIDDQKGIIAHVWVRHGDTDIIGGESASRFAVLARFPGQPNL
jgi:hypothetical protein